MGSLCPAGTREGGQNGTASSHSFSSRNGSSCADTTDAGVNKALLDGDSTTYSERGLFQIAFDFVHSLTIYICICSYGVVTVVQIPAISRLNRQVYGD